MITKFPKKKGDKYEALKFYLNDEKYISEKIELGKVNKEIIHYSLMKDNDEFKEHFQPRMFFNDSNKLIVRSKGIEDGAQFVIDLLNYSNQEAATFKSYSDKNTKGAIRVSMKFDIVMMQQALVKIGLNALMNYYPETKYNPLLRPAKNYVINGTAIRTAIDKKIDLLDTPPYIHSILFYQLKKGLVVRLSLFGGNFTYKFLIEDLNLFQTHGVFSGLEVDYNTPKQRHYAMDEYLLNRVKDLGYFKNIEIGL